jgi:hypothetical protein
MAERLSRLPDEDLLAALIDVGRYVDFPVETNVAPAVYRRIRETAVPLPRRSLLERLVPARPLRRAAMLALALVILAGGVAVAGLLGVPGLKLIFRPQTPPSAPVSPSASVPPLGTSLYLGIRVSPERAAREVAYPIVRPRLAGLPRPQYYILRFTSGGEVSLAYRAGPGLPAAPTTHVGLLVFEFQGTFNPEFLQKVVGGPGGTVVEPVQVNEGAGYWIAGAPHEVMLVDRHGRPFPETVRLAGNTLVWQQGDLTMRIEGRFGKAQALRIANSVR